MSGVNVEAKGSAALKLGGATAELKGSTKLDLDGGSLATLKGGMVMVN